MSAKKGAPALYELYHTGKSPRKGFLRRKSKVAYSDVSSVASKPGKEVSVKNNNGPAVSVPVNTDDQSDDSCFMYSEGRLKIDFSIWIFVLMVAALGMSILAAYQLGKTSDVSDNIAVAESDSVQPAPAASAVKANSGNTTPPSDEMQAALESDAYPGLITGKVRKDNDLPQDSQGGSSAYERPARCLIVLGHNNPEDLKVVQEFFAENGVDLDVAKRGREFVLVTKDGFVSSKEPIYQDLKDKIYSVGEKYIVNRPSGGIYLNLKTFKSSYPIDTNMLDFDIDMD